MRVNHSAQQLMLCNRKTVLAESRTKSSERISSGVIMNRASDNASGLAIYQEIHKRVIGLEQAGRNTQDGMSMLQTADGGLQEIQSNIKRMKELVIQSNSDTLTNNDRSQVQGEVDQIKKTVDDIANNSEFNNIKLLNQNTSLAIKISDAPNVAYNINLFNCTSNALNIDTIDLSTKTNRDQAFGALDNASATILDHLADVGSKVNGLQHTYGNLINSSYNYSSTEANIHDTNIAYESMEMVRTNILQNVTDSLFAQVADTSKGDLNLLRG